MTQPVPSDTDVDLVAEVLARHESRYPGSAAADVVDALARAGRLNLCTEGCPIMRENERLLAEHDAATGWRGQPLEDD